MTAYTGHEKPSLDDLMQYGVLGMKWGKTRVRATGSQIRSARRAVVTANNKVQDQRDKVRATKRGTPERDKANQKLNQMNVAFLKNPNRAVAARLTRGEKAIAIILLTPAGAAAAIGATSAISRRIEKRQDDKSYDKKLR